MDQENNDLKRSRTGVGGQGQTTDSRRDYTFHDKSNSVNTNTNRDVASRSSIKKLRSSFYT